jgi:hypothetical protein
MIRGIKKQLHSWRMEINALWSRLTSFHRTALGIVLSVAMILIVRSASLDPLQQDLEKKISELVANSVPAEIVSPESDNDIQELLMRIENIEPVLDNARETLKQTIYRRSPLRFEQKSDAVAETYRLVTRAGLRVKSYTEPLRANDQQAHVLPVSEHAYVLEGDFGGIFAFLRFMDAFRWPCRLWAVDISAVADEEGKTRVFNGRPLIRLSFLHRLYYYNYEKNQ